MSSTPPPSPPARLVQDLEPAARRRLIARTAVHILTVAILLVGAYYLAPLEGGNAPSVGVRLVCSLALVIGVVVWQVRAVATAEYPQTRAVEALVFASLMVIVVFATSYLALSQQQPLAFSEPLRHTSALYFTLTTLTTTGFGDITANRDGSRSIVMVQMVADVAVLGAAIRLIVGRARSRIGYPGATAQTASSPQPWETL
jgi:voltage-gated potassium channel